MTDLSDFSISVEPTARDGESKGAGPFAFERMPFCSFCLVWNRIGWLTIAYHKNGDPYDSIAQGLSKLT